MRKATLALALLLFVAPAEAATPTPIQHVVVIVQIGRSMNNLFNGYPGANTVTTDPYTGTNLSSLSLAATTCTLDHSHTGFVTDYASGAMNGFASCAYSYVPQSEAQPYWNLAAAGGLAVNAFSAGQAEAAGYLDILGAQEGYPYAAASADDLNNTCGNVAPLILTIDMRTAFPGTAGPQEVPCYTFPTLLDSMETAGYTWKYYCNASGTQWCLALAFSGIYNTPSRKARVITPETQVLTDIAAGTLSNLTIISPEATNSDRSAGSSGGPAWVASIVTALQASKFWNSTAVIVTWTAGSWYDNVAPSVVDAYHYGFRVPIIVDSPFAKVGYVDTTRRTTAAIPAFIESVFALPSLAQLDAKEPDDLFGFFDFSRNQRWRGRL